MAKNLKELLVDYRNCNTSTEKDDVLFHVYGIRTYYEKNNNGKRDRIFKLRFKIASMQKARNHIYGKYSYISKSNLDEYILLATNYIFENGNVDFTKSERQIEVWFIKTLSGRVHNLIDVDGKGQEKNVTHVIQDEDGEEIGSLYDEVAFNRYEEKHIHTSFEEFINSIGGYNQILSKKQFEVYTLIHAGYTQQEIADKFKTTQQNIHKLLKASRNKIAKEYINYRLIHISHKAHSTNKIIEDYLHTYKTILEFDVTDSFDYFGYTYKFLKEQYNSYSLHNDKSYTVFDVIFDGLRPQEQELFMNLVNSFSYSKINFTGREKGRIVQITNRILEKYINDIYKATIHISNKLIDSNKSTKSDINDYDYFIDNIS